VLALGSKPITPRNQGGRERLPSSGISDAKAPASGKAAHNGLRVTMNITSAITKPVRPAEPAAAQLRLGLAASPLAVAPTGSRIRTNKAPSAVRRTVPAPERPDQRGLRQRTTSRSRRLRTRPSQIAPFDPEKRATVAP
jgi:hypothetical protein